ncbi:Penicillin-binding protein 1A [Escherichia coli]|uniref:peptidoglycan glycosyltransferase n=1 Tax=Escherichia coli TaxID=562 RepID=A0A377D929_ECOLX|nr:Penicillin-binding protein 1A [Escherichia coli]
MVSVLRHKSISVKTVDQLTLNEMAVIAGLPKAPSTFNPLYSMDRAVARRNVVLSRMLDEGYITQQQFDQTRTEAINANYHAPEIAFSAPYLSEMVRQEMYNRYGESAYEDGYRITPPSPAKCSRPHSRRYVITCWTTTCATAIAARQMCWWKVGESAWDTTRLPIR